MAKANGVDIQSYHADNLRFNDNNFTGDCVRSGQTISFCGVGAHHQNAIVERKNKDLTNGARTVLLHAKRKWPKIISTILWPFSLQSIVDRHNHLSLDKDGKSPLEKFTQTKDEINPADFHTRGCPVYILDSENHSGGLGTPKWDPKSHAGIYLGRSPNHAGSVALVVNLSTGLVSPQFHVIFDDEFTTVDYLDGTTEPPNWPKLCAHALEHSTTNNNLPHAWLHPNSPIDTVSEEVPPTTDPEGASPTAVSEGVPRQSASDLHTVSTSLRSGGDYTCTDPPSQSVGGDATNYTQPFVNLDTLGLRRSARIKKNPMTRPYVLMIMALSAFVQSCPRTLAHCYQARRIAYNDFLDTNFDGTPNHLSPLAQIYATSKTDNETYHLGEMLKQPDRHEFLKAMQAEVEAMFKQKIWKRVPKKLMLDHYKRELQKGIEPKRQQLAMIWSFKRKRKPDGTLDKYKARLCCHGGQQEFGINYWDTYAPVVSWSSVRILMTLANLHNLHTKAIDFVLAYPQAKVKTTIFLKTPAGVVLTKENGEETVLLLLRNLYGLKDAGATWFEHLSKGLANIGFIPTESDPCVFIQGTNILLQYVDDCVIISRSEGEANTIFNKLKQQGFELTDEGTMETYLGIQIDKHTNGGFTLSQPYLIDRLLNSIHGMNSAKSSKSPAASTIILTKDKDGIARKENWNYRSIIGMLNYLVNTTQPDLTYAVHQCARFSNDPKHTHEQAVKRILRYLLHLKRSNKIGMKFSPILSKSMEVYVDASFAGDWNTAWSDEPTSVMSRTGYIIFYSNCPIVWCSKLQTEIALSTTESEYIALSQSLRDAIPLIGFLKEIQLVIPNSKETPTIHCSIFEDNKGCIDLVNTPRMRPRTKHIALKYHHFRSHVKNKLISIQHIETENQIADIFTKALPDPQFQKLRLALNGLE